MEHDGSVQVNRGLETEAIISEVETNGYAIVENVIPRETCDAVLAKVDFLMDSLAIPFGQNAFLGRHTRRIFNLLARDRLFESAPTHRELLGVVEGVLDPECLLSSLTAIEMQPGQARQPPDLTGGLGGGSPPKCRRFERRPRSSARGPRGSAPLVDS